jgi:predicted metal-dependent phosphoesterase TrpH
VKIDLHCHSKYSCDTNLEPEEVIREALEKELDGVCFTEHHSLVASSPVEKIEIPRDFYVFRGMEISTGRGHLLVYGLKDDSWNKWSESQHLDALAVMESVHDLGGICIPAHPFRGWDSFGEDILELNGFDALETHNGMNSIGQNQKAIKAALLRHLPSIGGSDCHLKEQVGRAFTWFKNPVYTINDLVEEIRKGNCEGKSVVSSPF